MNMIKSILPRVCVLFLLFTLVCGVVYTGVVTGAVQLLFPFQANGSIIEVNGVRYSTLLGQRYTSPAHLWGRPTNLDASTYKDQDGKALVYAAPSNLSPAGEEFAVLVAKRVAEQRALNPDMGDTAVPVDLVTCSGSGLDPDISPAAAAYQVKRIAKASGKTEEEVQAIISRCTSGRFLGLFGEETVNVLKVNLMLDGLL